MAVHHKWLLLMVVVVVNTASIQLRKGCCHCAGAHPARHSSRRPTTLCHTCGRRPERSRRPFLHRSAHQPSTGHRYNRSSPNTSTPCPESCPESPTRARNLVSSGCNTYTTHGHAHGGEGRCAPRNRSLYSTHLRQSMCSRPRNCHHRSRCRPG